MTNQSHKTEGEWVLEVVDKRKNKNQFLNEIINRISANFVQKF